MGIMKGGLENEPRTATEIETNQIPTPRGHDRWSWKNVFQGARNGLAFAGLTAPVLLFITGKTSEAYGVAAPRPDELVRTAEIMALYTTVVTSAFTAKRLTNN